MEEIGTRDVIEEYLNEIKKIDVIQELHLMTWPFCLSTELWQKHRDRKSSVDLSKIKKIKYFDEYGTKLSTEVNQLPRDKGGIYLYVIENSIIANAGSYIMYVGRARITDNENLQNRAKSHYSQYLRHEENERLERLFDNWKPYIYFLYLPIEGGNDQIDLVEDELIVALTPPCNKEYPSPKIRKKLSAFNYS